MAVGYKDSKTPEEIRDLWSTPQWVFDSQNKIYSFGLDVAANEFNRKCDHFLDEQMDGLTSDWSAHIAPGHNAVWCNPPYSDIAPWLKKAELECIKNGLTTVLLIPYTPDAGWWPRSASRVDSITGYENPLGRNISGRIQFVRADTGEVQRGNNKGSCFVVYSPGSLGAMQTRYIGIETLMPIENLLKYNKIKAVA